MPATPFGVELTQPNAAAAALVAVAGGGVICCSLNHSMVPQLLHVPLLPETVRRLLLPPYMAQHVLYLKSDRSHGAAELAAYVLQVWHSVTVVLTNLSCHAHSNS